MRESRIERRLASAVKTQGGLCLKFVSRAFSGVPDRIILLPDGKMAFAELKAPGQQLRPLQEHRQRMLQRLGLLVYVIDCAELLGGILSAIQSP